MSKALIALTAAAALAFAGCGGGSDSTATSKTATTPQTTTGAQKPKPAEKPKDNGSQSATTSPSPTASSNGGDGGSSAAAPGVPTSKGGDNSIQTFGGEASSSDRSQATSTAQAYLNARAAKQWDTACSYLAGPLKQQLEALLAQAKAKTKGCAAGMEAMSTGVPPSALRKAATLHVLSLRVKGPQAFLIYRDGEGTPSALPMTREGGAWKVGALAGSALLL